MERLSPQVVCKRVLSLTPSSGKFLYGLLVLDRGEQRSLICVHLLYGGMVFCASRHEIFRWRFVAAIYERGQWVEELMKDYDLIRLIPSDELEHLTKSLERTTGSDERWG